MHGNPVEHRLFLALWAIPEVAEISTARDRTTGVWRVDYVQAFGQLLRRRAFSDTEFLNLVMEAKR